MITFGPTSSPLLGRAAAYAGRHATTSAELGPGMWRAGFSLVGRFEKYLVRVPPAGIGPATRGLGNRCFKIGPT